MLPIVMMPIVLPLLMTGVLASNGILNDSTQSNWQQWVTIVAVLDLIYLTICFLLFEYVLEE
jgi:heme exporter protein B